MSEVFVSSKREDETRDGRLVRALEGSGVSVQSVARWNPWACTC